MVDVVKKRRAADQLRWLALAALAIAVATGCSSSGSTPARVVETKPADSPAPASAAAAKTTTAPAEVRAMDLREGAPEEYLEIDSSAPLVWTSYRNPEGKVVLELPNATPGPKLANLTQDTGLVAGVRVERDNEGSRPMTRLVITTRHEVEHSVSADGLRLQVKISPVDGAAPAAAAPAKQKMSFAPVEGAPPSPAPTSAPAPTSVSTAPVTPAPAIGTPDQPLVGAPPTGTPASRLDGIQVVSSDPDHTVIRINGDGDFPYSSFALESPTRFVIDLQGVLNRSAKSTMAVDNGPVQRIRVAQFKPAPKAVSRVVFELAQTSAPTIQRSANALIVTFGRGAAMAAAPATTMDNTPPAQKVIRKTTPSQVTGTTSPAPAPAATPKSTAMAAPTPTPATGSANSSSGVKQAMVMDQPPAAPPPPPPARSTSQDLPRVEGGHVLPAQADLGLLEPGAAGANKGGTSGALTSGAGGQLSLGGATEETFVGEPIDLKVTNADVTEVLRTFAQISGLNIVVQPGVTGTVTAELENVPWDQALYEVLKINGLNYELNGNVMRIAPNTVLKAEASERQALAAARALAIPLKTILKRLSYANAAYVANLLRNGQAGLLSARGSVIVDERTNTLIIKELPSYLDTVVAVINDLDTPEPQVIIEARIIETTKQFSRNLGVTWGFNAISDAAHGNTTGLVFPNNGTLTGNVNLPPNANNGAIGLTLGNVLNTFTLDLTLAAAESEGLINVLSAPKVATLNNQQASVQSGVQIPVQTVANGTVSVQYINATLRLDVTPQITAEGTVLMDITISKRQPELAFLVPGSTNAPIATKDAHTRLVVRDGGTAVIGGIYQITSNNNENRIPGLGRIPIIGNLFKNKAQSEENDELLIFITPRVIKL
jgi:type IV pilus assembly protein PilQ